MLLNKLFAAVMSSAPETVIKSVRPETECVSLGQESRAEPHPDWKIAVETWGAAWEFHQFGLGSLFGIVGLFALIAFFKLLKDNRGGRQKKVLLVVLSQIVVFGL